MKVKNVRYLFVCQHNFTRSKHGAEFFEGYLKGKNLNGVVDSAGIGLISFLIGKRINKEFIKKFDLIFVMEKYMKDFIMEKFNIKPENIVVLGIADVYGFMRRKSVSDLDRVFEGVDWEKYLKRKF